MNRKSIAITLVLFGVPCALAAPLMITGVQVGIDEIARRRALSAEEPFDDEHIALAEAQGNEIAEALFAYRESHGTFPESLGDLVPGFLPRIDPPAAGAQWWEYGIDPQGDFWLTFGTQLYGAGDLYPSHSLSSSKPGEWYGDY